MKAKCQYLHTDPEKVFATTGSKSSKERIKNGEDQKQCPACGLWVWDDEILKLSEHFTTERVN